ncbi:MAG: type II toxin-antitoxin system PemK/MazF family toxin [Bacilli bacterium]|jgi:mRNA-degrading endonuclease toxin of MazEF toxin-antitoxin module
MANQYDKKNPRKKRLARIQQDNYVLKKDVLPSDTLEEIGNWLSNAIRYEKYLQETTLLYDLRRGDVYEIDYGGSVGNELKGRHYGVILHDSNEHSQTVLVCPLVSVTENDTDYSLWRINIGLLEWRYQNYESIALISQIRVIDKVRIYAKPIINLINIPENERPNRVPVAVLTDEQMKLITDGFIRLISERTIY